MHAERSRNMGTVTKCHLSLCVSEYAQKEK